MKAQYRQEYVKFYGLAIALALAALAIALLGEGPSQWMRWFMALTFTTLGGFKLLGYKEFVMGYADYDLLAQKVPGWKYVYPFIELAFGALYAINVHQLALNVVVLVILSIGALSVYLQLRRGQKIHCLCLGSIIKLPLSEITFREDVVMAGMAAAMAVRALV